MDLFLREAADRIGTDDALTKVDALMNWRAFGPILHRAWYFGQAKTHAQLTMAAISQNLLKAANKIKITPKAHNAA